MGETVGGLVCVALVTLVAGGLLLVGFAVERACGPARTRPERAPGDRKP